MFWLCVVSVLLPTKASFPNIIVTHAIMVAAMDVQSADIRFTANAISAGSSEENSGQPGKHSSDQDKKASPRRVNYLQFICTKNKLTTVPKTTRALYRVIVNYKTDQKNQQT
jgi:hypothetical protein